MICFLQFSIQLGVDDSARGQEEPVRTAFVHSSYMIQYANNSSPNIR